MVRLLSLVSSAVPSTLCILLLAPFLALAEPRFIVKNYTGFTVYIDCRHNGPIATRCRSYPTRVTSRLDDFELAANDVFVDTHNVITPDRWWKVIYRVDTNTYIAWIF